MMNCKYEFSYFFFFSKLFGSILRENIYLFATNKTRRYHKVQKVIHDKSVRDIFRINEELNMHRNGIFEVQLLRYSQMLVNTPHSEGTCPTCKLPIYNAPITSSLTTCIACAVRKDGIVSHTP